MSIDKKKINSKSHKTLNASLPTPLTRSDPLSHDHQPPSSSAPIRRPPSSLSAPTIDYRGRGKRGVAKCKKKLKLDDVYIQLGENNLPIGRLGSTFDSWLGMAPRTTFPE
ncbi:hypothetical protein Hdeb2414_s0018g00520421 [Helianthus debilis subsp. tardiflorus]